MIKSFQKIHSAILRLSQFIPSAKLTRIYYLHYKNVIGEYLFLRGFFIPSKIAAILGRPIAEINELLATVPFDENVKDLKVKDRIAWLESNLFMKNQLLKDTDCMSMAHGIEVRVPFLGQAFVATTNEIAPSVRFPERPKGLLIEAFKSILPTQIWNRPKMGFSFPLQQWFLKHGRITDECIYENYPDALKQIRLFKNGKLHWPKAYALYQVFLAKSKS